MSFQSLTINSWVRQFVVWPMGTWPYPSPLLHWFFELSNGFDVPRKLQSLQIHCAARNGPHLHSFLQNWWNSVWKSWRIMNTERLPTTERLLAQGLWSLLKQRPLSSCQWSLWMRRITLTMWACLMPITCSVSLTVSTYWLAHPLFYFFCYRNVSRSEMKQTRLILGHFGPYVTQYYSGMYIFPAVFCNLFCLPDECNIPILNYRNNFEAL